MNKTKKQLQKELEDRKRKPKDIQIGQEVFIIEKDLTISKKKIAAIINEGNQKKYKLNVEFCGGLDESEIFLTQQKAEVGKKNFLDGLKFSVGDLVVFEYESFRKKKKTIGRITKIKYSAKPYEVKGSDREFNEISDEDIFMKVKNEYIENYGNLQELYEEFEEKEKELNKVIKKIHNKHDELEKELETSIRKQYSVFHWNKSKPLFKDRFSYEENE